MATRPNVDGVLCGSCRLALLRWVDELSPLDRELALLSGLCEAAAQGDGLDGETVAALGAAIQRHRERRALLDYCFLGRELITLAVVGLDEGEAAVRGELTRFGGPGRRRRLC